MNQHDKDIKKFVVASIEYFFVNAFFITVNSNLFNIAYGDEWDVAAIALYCTSFIGLTIISFKLTFKDLLK